MVTVLLYLFTALGIEVSLLFDINSGWAVFVYGLMLISLLVFAAFDPERRPMLIGMSGIPVIRIVGYGVSFSNITLASHFNLAGLVLLLYVIYALRVSGLAVSNLLRRQHNWLLQISIVLSGVVVGFCQFSVYPQATLYFSSVFKFSTFVIALVLLAFVEEIVFRGMALSGFAKRFSPRTSIVFVAFFYTCLFIPFGSIELGFVMFLTSLFYGIAVVKSSGLYGVIGAHFISSLFYYLILPATLN